MLRTRHIFISKILLIRGKAWKLNFWRFWANISTFPMFSLTATHFGAIYWQTAVGTDLSDNWSIMWVNNKMYNLVFNLAQGSDMVVAELSMTYERSKYIDFSFPLDIQSITFITSREKFKENTQFIYKVFDPFVWLVLAFFIIGMTILVYLMSKNRLNYVKRHYCWDVFRILLCQSIGKFKFETLSMELLFIYWLSFCLYISSFYSNTIYSSMVVPANLKIDTIEQLLDAMVEQIITVYIMKEYSYFGLIKVWFRKLILKLIFQLKLRIQIWNCIEVLVILQNLWLLSRKYLMRFLTATDEPVLSSLNDIWIISLLKGGKTHFICPHRRKNLYFSWISLRSDIQDHSHMANNLMKCKFQTKRQLF